jgi:hypothetical protein
MKRSHIFVLAVCSVVVSSVLLVIPAQFILAQSAEGIPFGGMITLIRPCNDGLLVTIKGWPSGNFKYQYGVTRQHLVAPPSHVGQWLLGNATGVATCVSGSKLTGVGMLMIRVGTGI